MRNSIFDEPSETQALLERARAGDAEAVERLFQGHREYLRQVIAPRLASRLHARVDASDIVQEAEAVAARRMSDYLQRQPVAFRLWLRQIAQDQLLMAYRRHIGAERRTVMREIPLPEQSSLELARQLVDQGPSPSQQAVRSEQVHAIRQALARLSTDDCELVMMRSHEQLSFEEIGYVLRIEPTAARKRYGRALLRLARIVHDIGLTESQI